MYTASTNLNILRDYHLVFAAGTPRTGVRDNYSPLPLLATNDLTQAHRCQLANQGARIESRFGHARNIDTFGD